MSIAAIDFQVLANAGFPPARFAAGDVVFSEGDKGDAMYVVRSGELTIEKGGKVMETVGPGGVFGEMALIDGGERVATVTATSPLELLVLSRHDFNEMLEFAMPQVAPKLLAVIGARMRAIEDHNEVNATLGL
jgi:CRP-like cAMP-binding protein